MTVSRKDINCKYYRFPGAKPEDDEDRESSSHDCYNKDNQNYRNDCNINKCPLKKDIIGG